MARSNLNKNTTTSNLKKATLNKKLGIYIFVDDDGNVTQIKKDKKIRTKYDPNEATKVDTTIGVVYVIGIDGEGPIGEDGSTIGATTAMGIGDTTEAYAKYV